MSNKAHHRAALAAAMLAGPVLADLSKAPAALKPIINGDCETTVQGLFAGMPPRANWHARTGGRRQQWRRIAQLRLSLDLGAHRRRRSCASRRGGAVGQAGLRPIGPVAEVDEQDAIRTVQTKMLCDDGAFWRRRDSLEASRTLLDDAWTAMSRHRLARDLEQVAARESASLLETARWLTSAALPRNESRGLHTRQAQHATIFRSAGWSAGRSLGQPRHQTGERQSVQMRRSAQDGLVHRADDAIGRGCGTRRNVGRRLRDRSALWRPHCGNRQPICGGTDRLSPGPLHRNNSNAGSFRNGGQYRSRHGICAGCLRALVGATRSGRRRYMLPLSKRELRRAGRRRSA